MALLKNFSAASLNFWARLVIFFLGLLTALGIKFPDSPETLGTDIVTTISSSGFYSVIALMAVSVIMPIYNFIRSKPKISALAFFGSINTWIYIGTFIFGLLILVGINIPGGTAEALVGAIFAKDWSAVIMIMAGNVLDPLIRWLRDKRIAEVARYEAQVGAGPLNHY